jgi:hypothetical protein
LGDQEQGRRDKEPAADFTDKRRSEEKKEKRRVALSPV